MSEFDFKPNPKSISEEEWDKKYEKIFSTKDEKEKQSQQELQDEEE